MYHYTQLKELVGGISTKDDYHLLQHAVSFPYRQVLAVMKFAERYLKITPARLPEVVHHSESIPLTLALVCIYVLLLILEPTLSWLTVNPAHYFFLG